MTIEDDIRFFEQVPALALLGHEPLRILAIGAESRYVHGGDVLFRRGETGDAQITSCDGDHLTAVWA